MNKFNLSKHTEKQAKSDHEHYESKLKKEHKEAPEDVTEKQLDDPELIKAFYNMGFSQLRKRTASARLAICSDTFDNYLKHKPLQDAWNDGQLEGRQSILDSLVKSASNENKNTGKIDTVAAIFALKNLDDRFEEKETSSIININISDDEKDL